MANVSCDISDTIILNSPLELAAMIYLIMFGTIAFIGNVITLIVIRKRRPLHTPSYYLLANLSCGDLLLNASVSLCAAVTLGTRQWVFGAVFCYLNAYMKDISIMQTLATLAFISVDRYVAICKPLRYRSLITTPRIRLAIVYSWVHPCIVNLAPAFGIGKYVYKPNVYGCRISAEPDTRAKEFCYLLLASTITPFVVIMIFW